MSWYGRCAACGARADLAYQPGSDPPRRVCGNCYQPLPHVDPTPLLDEYLEAARDLATTVRDSLDHPGAITRGVMTKVLERFERMDRASERSKD